MTLIDHRMAYEKAARLLELIQAYGWNQADIDRQAAIVAERKAKIEQAEREG